jgi:signal transduction histidine kinase
MKTFRSRSYGAVVNSLERLNGGSDQTEDLVDRIRSAGLPVALTITGPRRALPTAVDGVAYCVIETALVSIRRDADPAATTSVHIGYNPGELVVQVEDDGQDNRQHNGQDDGQATRRTPATPGDRLNGMPGDRLNGMVDRVAALGGRLHAEPRPYGGFTVRAELPVPDPL